MIKLKNIILKDIRIEDNLKINNTFIKEPRKKNKKFKQIRTKLKKNKIC